MPKGCPEGTKVDAETHQKSVPKRISKKIREKHENHVYLNGEIIEAHCKTFVFEDLAGCVHERERYQTSIKNDS